MKRYDLIVSISTFEHIGYDEGIRYGKLKDNDIQSDRLLTAVARTIGFLNPGGIFIFTVPLGFNPYLDSLLENNDLHLTGSYFYKRFTKNNQWKLVSYDEVNGIKYGEPFQWANGLMIGIFRKAEA